MCVCQLCTTTAAAASCRLLLRGLFLCCILLVGAIVFFGLIIELELCRRQHREAGQPWDQLVSAAGLVSWMGQGT